MPKLKGYIPPNKKPEIPSFTDGIYSVYKTIEDLNDTKKEVVDTLNTKVKEVDTHIGKAETILDKKITEVDQTIAKAESDAVQMIKDIQDIPQLKGKDAEEVDTEKLVKDILAKLPKPDKFDEKGFIKKVIKAIPENKASLKIIQEKFEIDPMSIIDKIMALPEEKRAKLKFARSNVDGLEQTIQAFQSQLGRGYLHGGGDSVVAGTNVTITTNTSGKKTINAFENNGVWLNDNLTTNARLTVSAVAPVNPAVNDLWYDIS